MIGIAICTHSNFADGLKNACEMIAGEQEKFVALGFDGNEQLLDYGERIKEAVSEFDDGCIFVVDLINATPYNASLLAVAGTENVILTGCSLPMVLELLIRRNGFEDNAEALGKEIMSSSCDYISLIHSRDVFTD